MGLSALLDCMCVLGMPTSGGPRNSTHSIVFMAIFCLFCFFWWLWWYSLDRAKKRAIKTVRKMANRGQKEIGGYSVEYWIDLIEQDSSCLIHESKAMALTYKGHDYFFIDGKAVYRDGDYRYARSAGMCQDVLFLIAIGGPAVRFLAKQEHLFRLITGSKDLALFSIFRCSDFADALEEQ